jgi:hypothetical protein
VRLNIGDGIRVDSRHQNGFRDCFGLTINAGRQVTYFRRTIIVNGRTFDHRVNAIAVIDSVLQTSQNDDANAAAEYSALRVSIECAAMTVRRQDLPLLEKVTLSMRNLDGHAASERHIAFAVYEALTGDVNGHQ